MLLGVVLALAGIAQGQDQTKQTGQTVPPAIAVPAPTNSDQDQTPIPVDPKHQKDIDGDVKAGKAYTAELEKTLKFSKDKVGQERLEHVGRIIANSQTVGGKALSAAFSYDAANALA